MPARVRLAGRDLEPVLVESGERFAVLDKPAGWLTVPSRHEHADPRPVAGRWLEQKLSRRVWPVHRLDEPVSGVVIFALDGASHRKLCAAFESRAIRKLYEAWSGGSPPPDAGDEIRVESKLFRGKRRTYEAAHGRLSITLLRWIGSVGLAKETEGAGAWNRWAVEPLTGRPHQIRAHLSSRGWPILNDSLYGGAAVSGMDGIGLRAVRLEFGCAEWATELALPAVVEVGGL